MQSLERLLVEAGQSYTEAEMPDQSKQNRQYAWDHAGATLVAMQLVETAKSEAQLQATTQPCSGDWLSALPLVSAGTLLDRDTLPTV